MQLSNEKKKSQFYAQNYFLYLPMINQTVIIQSTSLMKPLICFIPVICPIMSIQNNVHTILKYMIS